MSQLQPARKGKIAFRRYMEALFPKTLMNIRREREKRTLYSSAFTVRGQAGCQWLMPVILPRRQRSGGSRFKARLGK
jgi:hypothetical protein